MYRILVIGLVFIFSFSNQSLTTRINPDLCNEVPEENLTSYFGYNTTQNCGCAVANTCPRKCCRPGYYLRGEYCFRHSDSNLTFHLEIYNKDVLEKEVTFSEKFLVGVMGCKYFRLNPQIRPSDIFHMQKNGQLWVPAFKKFYKNSQYCTDNANDSSSNINAFLCFEEYPDLELGRQFNVIGMIISMPFLLSTFVVYTLLPKRNLHMKALMFYVLSLLLGDIFLVFIQLGSDISSPHICVALGIIIVFFFLLSFFWMNVICLDIWLTFSGRQGFEARSLHEEKRKLYIYCLYAWGMAAGLSLMVFLINQFSDSNSWYYPGVGAGQCFIRNNLPLLLYFYLPIGILVTINIIFFILTSRKILEAKRNSKVLSKNDSQMHYQNNKKRFNLYLKLLLAMGVNWTLEFVSFLIGWQFNIDPKFWYISDFCNAIYGVFIFFLFVFKKKIWNLLRNKFNFVADISKTSSTKAESS